MHQDIPAKQVAGTHGKCRHSAAKQKAEVAVLAKQEATKKASLEAEAVRAAQAAADAAKAQAAAAEISEIVFRSALLDD